MKKKIISLLIIAGLLGVGLWDFTPWGNRKTQDQYQFVEITRGDLENTVSSTGTISPVRTVEIGTQVSGTIARIYVDYNDQVVKGQLLAVLDTFLLKNAVLDAEANVERVEAQREEALADYKRDLQLFEQGHLSEAQFLPVQINVKTQQAALKSAKAGLQRAQLNLRNAVIRSPIKGTVIQRNVEAGQTVAASLQTPTLFVIAEDLSKMEIHAQVDESDIGLIEEKQPVRFTVQAYPDETFSGSVRQIWLQPTTIQNVVNYTVIVDAANDKNLLLPGMTATVDFIVEQREDVLLVPNTALRFQPTPEMMAEFRENRQKRFDALPDSVKEQLQQRRRAFRPMIAGDEGMGRLFGEGRGIPENLARLWYVDEGGNLGLKRVRTGVTDGRMTEIIGGRGIQEGMQVISGILQPDQQRKTATRSYPRGFGRRGF